uniref:Uncharacterized protein n=1 Tax=viral metagenome TaxID=1070528 RepID=A0A6C0DUC9_9ZZZZ
MNKLNRNILLFILIIILIVVTSIFIHYNIEGFESNSQNAKYNNTNIEVQYHDTVENILKNNTLDTININKTFFPEHIPGSNVITGNLVAIETVGAQANILYNNPANYVYSLSNYVPDYYSATYLSRSGSFANTPPQNYVERIDYDEFSEKYSDFIPIPKGNKVILPKYHIQSFPTSYFANTEVGKYSIAANLKSEPIVYGVTFPPVTTAAPIITKGILLVKDSSLNNSIGNQFQQTV